MDKETLGRLREILHGAPAASPAPFVAPKDCRSTDNFHLWLPETADGPRTHDRCKCGARFWAERGIDGHMGRYDAKPPMWAYLIRGH